MPRREPFLFQLEPRLAERVPWLSLGSRVTAIEPLAALGRAHGGLRLFVKRDDGFARAGDPAVAGAKLRKLEFLLADARRRGRNLVITSGAFGSNHLYATAACARALGIDTLGVTMPQPSQPHARQNLTASLAAGADLRFARGPLGALAHSAWALARSALAPGIRPYFVPPGGSSALGVLGAVEAALEIASQLATGEAPKFDYVFVPSGSCGLLAGLALGLWLAGLETEAVGVRVFPHYGCNEWTTRRLIRAAEHLLARAAPNLVAEQRGVPGPGGGPARQRVGRPRFRMLHEFFGSGYGVASDAGKRALAEVRELEGLVLEPTYGAKALAGMLAFVGAAERRRANALFVHTCHVEPVASPLARLPAGVPRRVKRFLSSEEVSG